MSKEETLKLVADIIDRNRLNGPIGGISVGEFLADKLHDMGLLAAKEEWGVKDFSGNIFVSKTKEEALRTAAFMNLSVYHHHAADWKEYDDPEIEEA